MAKKNTEEDFLSSVKKRLNKAIKADEHNRKEALECLQMLNGDNHWNDEEKKRRKFEGRPCLQVNLFPSFVNQVVGEMLHNRARAKVKPGDHKSSPQIAKIRSGIIANAEYRSNGEDIYMQAGKTQVACGYGAWRINTRYCEENPFIQEFYLEAVPNPFSVYLDHTRKDESGADAKWGFVITKMPRDDFESEWPHADTSPEAMPTTTGMKDELYYDKDFITVAEYYVVKPEHVTMCLMEDGSVVPKSEVDELIAKHKELVAERLSSQPAVPPPSGGPIPAPLPAPMPALPPEPRVVRERKTEVKRVKHYTLTATEILGPPKSKELSDKEYKAKLLDGEDVPGDYIPLVQILGVTYNIEGKTYNKGLISNAKDSQKLLNYWETATAEAIALAPKAPWVMTPRQVEGFEEDYKNANVTNNPFLLYNMDVDERTGSAAPPPQRQRPADPPVALFTQAGRAADNLKRVIGMFGHDLGEGGPERSAPAVWAKQKPGDISTYVFAYKLNRGIAHSAKIMNSMIAQVYDTERDVRLRNIDDTDSVVPVNTVVNTALTRVQGNPQMYKGLNPLKLVEMHQRGDGNAKFNDITIGKYEVVIATGPAYATARQESSAMLMNLVNSVPAIGKLGADLIVEGIDGVQAERLAARLRKTMPPGLVEPREGEKPFTPPPPPQVQFAMQKAKTEQIKQQKEILKTKVEMLRLYKETKESEHEVRKEILKVLMELHTPEAPQEVANGNA